MYLNLSEKTTTKHYKRYLFDNIEFVNFNRIKSYRSSNATAFSISENDTQVSLETLNYKFKMSLTYL